MGREIGALSLIYSGFRDPTGIAVGNARRRRRAGGDANDAILSYFAPLEGKIFFDRASGAGGASGVRLRRSASGAVASGDGYLML